MKKIINEIIAGLMGSMHNGSEGWSGKKLSAWAIVMCIIYAHYKWVEKGMPEFLSVMALDFGFVCTLYGINVTDKKLNQPGEPKPTIDETEPK